MNDLARFLSSSNMYLMGKRVNNALCLTVVLVIAVLLLVFPFRPVATPKCSCPSPSNSASVTSNTSTSPACECLCASPNSSVHDTLKRWEETEQSHTEDNAELSKFPVTLNCGNGVSPTAFLYDTSRDYLSQKVERDKIWEPTGVDNMLNALSIVMHPTALLPGKRPLMIDVGSNVGVYSLCAGKAGFDVVALEPTRNTAQLQRKSIQQSMLTDRIRLFNLALDSGPKGVAKTRRGCLKIPEPGTNAGSNHLSRLNADCDETPHMASLDELFLPTAVVEQWPGHLLYLKVEAEGLEGDVLLGGTSLFQTTPPCFVQLELNTNLGSPGGRLWIGHFMSQMNYLWLPMQDVTKFLVDGATGNTWKDHNEETLMGFISSFEDKFYPAQLVAAQLEAAETARDYFLFHRDLQHCLRRVSRSLQ
eukprot:TRINITY_DN4482_c0_g1_i1.p1 TRINITY_DN4482_c0_g1~~TRINITY_DN4482_c0_g1_i1.p1  ORF type:complete len:419 (+),score=36.08 TRINITY_DN4482_c0_g1_i1:51-1307(+)